MQELGEPLDDKEFRFRGKKVLLTYTHSGPLDKQKLHEFLNKKFKQDCDVKICHEQHADGEIHTHACVLLKKMPDVKNSRLLDYEGVHPNWRPPKSIEHWKNQVKYMDKEDPDVYGEITVPKDKDEEFAEVCAYVKECKTIKQVFSMGPYLRMISSKVNFWERFWKENHKKKVTKALYSMNNFRLQPITDWTKNWLVFGKAGTGKTQWALAHFQNPLLVSHTDDLKEFDPEDHDGIVFDDMSFKHLPSDGIIHLLDKEIDRSIHARFYNAEIPAGVPKIFCHNNDDIFIPTTGVSDEVLAGIKRRYNVIQVKVDLRNI